MYLNTREELRKNPYYRIEGAITMGGRYPLGRVTTMDGREEWLY